MNKAWNNHNQQVKAKWRFIFLRDKNLTHTRQAVPSFPWVLGRFLHICKCTLNATPLQSVIVLYPPFTNISTLQLSSLCHWKVPSFLWLSLNPMKIQFHDSTSEQFQTVCSIRNFFVTWVRFLLWALLWTQSNSAFSCLIYKSTPVFSLLSDLWPYYANNSRSHSRDRPVVY